MAFSLLPNKPTLLTMTLAPAAPHTLLIRCPNWVGDVVMATPAFACLRANFPTTRIVAVIRTYARGVIEDGPWFDQIITCDDKSWAGFWALCREIRALHPDMALLFTHSIRSKLTFFFGGARNRIGHQRGGANFLLTGGPVPAKSGHKFTPVPMAQYYLELCRFLRLDLPATPKPELFISPSVAAKAGQLLQKYGIQPEDQVIGLNPGAKFGSSKCWPPGHFARLIELLTGHTSAVKVLLLIGPGEGAIAEAIARATQAPFINTAADRIDLATLKPIVKRCQLLVTNDTGTRHYAVALDVPTVVLMGPTDPGHTAANLEKSVVIRKDLDCSPCHLSLCPKHHECMTQIQPEEVFAACRDLLDRHC